MEYQWYPGHMSKARRMMEEDRKLVDLIIEVLDARIPMSSRNPEIDELGRGKFRIVLLNKADLADPACSRLWVKFFGQKGIHALEVDSRTGAGVKALPRLVEEVCREKLQRDRSRGILNRPVRAMVVGIPNVGKSTFINAFAGKACTKTGNKPGVTKGKQWIRLNKGLELLDTPGILWPKFEDQDVGRRLAYIGSLNDDILSVHEMAADLLKELAAKYPGALAQRYGLEPAADGQGKDPALLLEEIARLRKCYGKGEIPDPEKAAAIVLEDFRKGRLGRLTLELPGGGEGPGAGGTGKSPQFYDQIQR